MRVLSLAQRNFEGTPQDSRQDSEGSQSHKRRRVIPEPLEIRNVSGFEVCIYAMLEEYPSTTGQVHVIEKSLFAGPCCISPLKSLWFGRIRICPKAESSSV